MCWFYVGIGYILGLITNFLISSLKQARLNRFNYSQTPEILLDASSNREIAEIISNSEGSLKLKILNELIKKINFAAKNGLRKLEIKDYKFNEQINKFYSKKELINYFKPLGYSISFRYNCIDDSSIDFISWR